MQCIITSIYSYCSSAIMMTVNLPSHNYATVVVVY